MTFATLLRLGRTSNLPTVWSNVLAGAALSGQPLRAGAMLAAVVAGSLFYVGGMFLNDAFDAEIDARERPERPIPAGQARRDHVFALGFAFLGAGLALLLLTGAAGLAPSGGLLAGAGLLTAVCVVVYDRWHKGHRFAPVVMGLCRAGLYSLGALAVAPAIGATVAAAAVSIALYVVGLTYLARFENASRIERLWPLAFLLAPFAVLALAPAGPHLTPQGAFVFLAALWIASLLYVGSAVRTALLGASTGSRRAVVSLIAALSLIDACFALRHGHTTLALVAVASFTLTRRLQRQIPGT